jgi:hypothetical protein
MTPERLQVYTLDVLPPGCTLICQSDTTLLEAPQMRLRFRFQARRPRWFRKDERSEWSGWFHYEGEPIRLRWNSFWER